jgi:endogenous inhibitor of DNA gyrase (YacG/DUF329 family)
MIAEKDKCPVCRKATLAPYAPFCSRRCADVDLHRWLSEGYSIPSVDADASGDKTGEA